MRDSQKGKVYAWERAMNPGRVIWTRTMDTEAVEAMVRRVWRAERGRYGRANQPAPVVRARRGSSAMASYSHELVFGTHCHNEYVVLHELAHLLQRDRSRGHGPKFVAVLIGLLARHLGRDADTLLASACEHGLKVHAGSIGAVPAYPWYKRLEPLLPCTAIEAAVAMGVSYRLVQGAALQLIRQGRAHWRGKTLVRTVIEKIA